MISQRSDIVACLEATGVKQIMFNMHDVPKSLPAAIVTMATEEGKLGTSRRYTATDITWVVHLIVNAQKVDDPDAELYALKENFRSQLVEHMHKDIPFIEYYFSRTDGARLVRIARLHLFKKTLETAS